MRISIRKLAGIFAITLAGLLAGAQLIRPNLTSPPTDATRTIAAQLGTLNPLVAVLDRSCGDCHSNETPRGWYTQVAPLSWVMSRGVKEGRLAVNFSEWGAYPPDQQRLLLTLSCQDATKGTMPMSAYTKLRPAARLSKQDVETICAAAR